LFLAAVSAFALDEPVSFSFDLPFPDNQATPVWLGHPAAPVSTFATLNLPITPPDAQASLVVTLYFAEKQDGFLRASWVGSQAAEVLSKNLYEGIGMQNQRSLLVLPNTMDGAGTLSLQSSSDTLGVDRIKLEWVENQPSLVSPHLPDMLVTPESGKTQKLQDLNGQINGTEPFIWNKNVVTVQLTDKPERVETGVEFNAELRQAPQAARISLKENGLPFGQRVVVWINQQRAGSITPSVPELTDEGYGADAKAPSAYVGWRDGSLFIPVSLLKMGVNAVQFSAESDSDASASQTTGGNVPPPLALKDVVLQLDYGTTTPGNSEVTTSNSPAPTSVPDGTTTPLPPSTTSTNSP
jgi:hypothetical protein